MKQAIYKYFKNIFAFNKTDRVWQMPFFAALGVGIVLLVSYYFGRLDLGLIALFGVNAFLYVPNTPIYHRMAVTMCCSFGVMLSFALGLATHLAPFSLFFVVFAVASLSSILVRYYGLGPPGYFFFVMSCVVGAFFPFGVKDIVMLVGLISLGTMVANTMAFLYSLSVVYCFKNKSPEPIPVRGYLGFDRVVVESLIIGVFVMISVFVGQIFDLEKSYWIAISCTAVMQGISINAIWIKQSQRIIGTLLGMGAGMVLFELQLHPLEFIALLTFLMFMGEWCVVRNYALAMIFFTPYVTYLAEINTLNAGINAIIEARMLDVIIGSILGLCGGLAIHNRRLRIYFTRFALKIFRKQK